MFGCQPTGPTQPIPFPEKFHLKSVTQHEFKHDKELLMENTRPFTLREEHFPVRKKFVP